MPTFDTFWSLALSGVLFYLGIQGVLEGHSTFTVGRWPVSFQVTLTGTRSWIFSRIAMVASVTLFATLVLLINGRVEPEVFSTVTFGVGFFGLMVTILTSIFCTVWEYFRPRKQPPSDPE